MLTAVMRLCRVYLMPIGVVCFRCWRWLSWNSHYVANDDLPLPLRVLAEKDAPLTPDAALRQLARMPGIERYDTHLSEAPVWFALHAQDQGGGLQVVEFPSRHAHGHRLLGCGKLAARSARQRTSCTNGAITAVKAGFVLRPDAMPAEVLCSAHLHRASARQRRPMAVQPNDLSVEQYHRKSGLLDGGMIVLSPVHTDHRADQSPDRCTCSSPAWLILNLRVAAISAGWDIQWLGQDLPADWLLMSRS